MGKTSTTQLYQWALDSEESLKPIESFFGNLRAELPIEIDNSKINIDFLKDSAKKIEELQISPSLFKEELHKI